MKSIEDSGGPTLFELIFCEHTVLVSFLSFTFPPPLTLPPPPFEWQYVPSSFSGVEACFSNEINKVLVKTLPKVGDYKIF